MHHLLCNKPYWLAYLKFILDIIRLSSMYPTLFFFLAIPNVIYLGSKALHIIGVWDSKIIGTMHF